jgi:hypothetical protein
VQGGQRSAWCNTSASVHDGVDQAVVPFLSGFPYLNTPNAGSQVSGRHCKEQHHDFVENDREKPLLGPGCGAWHLLPALITEAAAAADTVPAPVDPVVGGSDIPVSATTSCCRCVYVCQRCGKRTPDNTAEPLTGG